MTLDLDGFAWIYMDLHGFRRRRPSAGEDDLPLRTVRVLTVDGFAWIYMDLGADFPQGEK